MARRHYPPLQCCLLLLLLLLLLTLMTGCGEVDGEDVDLPAPSPPPGENRSPAAAAGADRTTHIDLVTVLDGSASFDPDGDPLDFSWTIIAQPPGNAGTLSAADTATPFFTPTAAGDYEIRLTVSDGRGGFGSDTVLITAVTPGTNLKPVADAGPDRSVFSGTSVALDGSGSRDPDGEILQFEWEIFSQPPGGLAVLSASQTANPFFTPTANGSYTMRLTVRDLQAATATDTVIITVFPPGANLPPVAAAGADTSVTVGAVVMLDGSASRDPEGFPLTFSWTLFSPAGSLAALGDADTPTPFFRADVGGTYRAELLVSDPQGATARASVTILAR
jgi:hypothetical protein